MRNEKTKVLRLVRRDGTTTLVYRTRRGLVAALNPSEPHTVITTKYAETVESVRQFVPKNATKTS